MNGEYSISKFISSKRHDSLFVIAAPFLAFLIIFLFCEPRYKTGSFLHSSETPYWLILTAILFTKSHIFLVFIRSHMNPDINKRFPLRFTLIPIILLIGMWISPIFFVLMSFIALYWDEWHSLMQTFGFGRIYDVKLGNNPKEGRALDIGLCFVLGLLPHVVLLTFIPEDIRAQGLFEFMDIDLEMGKKYGQYFSMARFPLIIAGVSYIAFYIYRYHLLIKRGYQFSETKMWLFISTGVSAVLIAGFYSVEEAAYFGNIYHAIQYYLIVYVSEGTLIKRKLTNDRSPNTTPKIFYFFLILILCVFLAAIRESSERLEFIGAFWLLTSLLHFWYDGFIWSVRRQDV